MKANLSIWGMYQYDKSLFDRMVIPTQLDKEVLVDNILLECNELQILYTDWNFLESAITAWSKKSNVSWQKIADTLELEYNPIENYDRVESWTDTHRSTGTVTDQSQSSGTENRADETSETDHRDGEVNSTLTHDGDRTETLRGTVATDGSVTHDEDRSGTESRSTTGSTSLHHVGEDSSTDSSSETSSTDTLNSVNGFNGTLTDQSMSPHDKSEVDGSLTKSGTHSGDNEYTDTGSSSETISGTTSGTTDYTDETESHQTSTGDNTIEDDYTDTYAETSEDESRKTGSLDSEITRSDTAQNTRTNNLVDTMEHTARIHGNIGTVTAQMMVTQQIELDKINLYDIITDEFKAKFCLGIYY